MEPRLPRHLLPLLVTLCAGSSIWADSPGLREWMSIGDSITHGMDSSSYRWFLQKILIDNGLS